MEWQVNGACNYDCTYCIQSKKRRVGIPEETTAAAIIRSFATLPGRWEIKMSGGEPFANPGFVRHIVPALAQQTPHLISVLTNFSAPVKMLEAFCKAAGDRLRVTSASIHLEFDAVDAFIAKAIAYRDLRQRFAPQASFVVNSVLVPGRLDAQVAVKARLEQVGFRYFPQLMKIKGGVFPYSGRDVALVEGLTGGSVDPKVVNVAPSYRGLHCEAGAWYFTVDQNGDAWSCRTGKRHAGPGSALHDDETDEPSDGAFLGNLADGSFRRRAHGGICDYDICPCTVPALRNIVRRPGLAPRRS